MTPPVPPVRRRQKTIGTGSPICIASIGRVRLASSGVFLFFAAFVACLSFAAFFASSAAWILFRLSLSEGATTTSPLSGLRFSGCLLGKDPPGAVVFGMSTHHARHADHCGVRQPRRKLWAIGGLPGRQASLNAVDASPRHLEEAPKRSNENHLR